MNNLYKFILVKLPVFIWLLLAFLAIGCSKDEFPEEPEIIDPSTPENAFVLQPEDTRLYMVNPNATTETAALFYNLKILSKSNFIVGQHNAFHNLYNDAIGDSDIKKTTGSDPGLLGSDFLFITDDLNDGTPTNWFYQQEQRIKADAVEAYNKGMVNAFSWHLREPYEGVSFYTSEMTDFQKNNAFKSILPKGENHEYYKQKIEKVAEVAKRMVGADGKLVPFIFRPFHEFDGDWFWWGASYCTPQQFIALWQFTVDYLRDTLNVNNILFAFSPDNSFISASEYLERYPGDNYVDIIGMDNYGDLNNQGQTGVDNANNKLQIISHLAIEKVKIAALTETGYFVTPGSNSPIPNFYSTNLYNAITVNNTEIGYMMFWYNSKDTYCTPAPGLPDTADFIAFANKPKSVLQNKLPNMYALPN
ncbi:glycoside hydrolase family 26 protein [Thalassobellus suaedae]|uniref:Glycosyl hydrolase n=1 Tax=Thalassobellus suaedae TaxID=3074124 RepID=A0ABY9XZI0_9FLAO|nr:glycosyl hydrolase [Flavobacteriaceae bacterium HL-DH10]